MTNMPHYYRAFEEKHRGSREEIKERLKVYLPFVLSVQHHDSDSLMIDVGCGRGEWLELLREHDISARGIDLDEGMLAACKERQFDVVKEDAFIFLQGLPSESVIGITGFHIIEHLAFEQMLALMQEALRVLKPGGLLIMETPNPENIIVGTENFYLDPTHIKPIPSQLLYFLAEHIGFARVKILRLNESSGSRNLKAASLSRVLFDVSPDYAIVAQKNADESLLLKTQSAFQKGHGIDLLTLVKQYDEKIQRMETLVYQLNNTFYRKVKRVVEAGDVGKLIGLFVRKIVKKLLRLALGLSRHRRPSSAPSGHPLGRGCPEGADEGLPCQNKKQLLIDVSTLIPNDLRTGIQRVVRSLLHELLQHPPTGYKIEPIYAAMDKKGFYYARDFVAKLQDTPSVFEDTAIHFQQGDLFLGLDWSPFIIPAQKKTLKKLKRAGVKIYHVVYDLLPLLKPDMFPNKLNEFYVKWLNVILKYDGAVCISKTVSEELRTWLHTHKKSQLDKFTIDWFHLGADLENSFPSWGKPEQAHEIIQGLKDKLSFLVVNTIEPRKGYAQLLDAFDKLWQQGEDIYLIIVGKQGWMVDDIVNKIRHHNEVGKRLIWLGAVSDEFLKELYHTASCLISPSEAEGFGLPLIEAAKYGVPIIARDIPVFREVAGDNAYYFHGTQGGVLADCIQHWLALYHQNKHPKVESLPWLTWRQSATQLKEAVLGKMG